MEVADGVLYEGRPNLDRSIAHYARKTSARTLGDIVKGLNRLFDSPEIQAVVGIFRSKRKMNPNRRRTRAARRRILLEDI